MNNQSIFEARSELVINLSDSFLLLIALRFLVVVHFLFPLAFLSLSLSCLFFLLLFGLLLYPLLFFIIPILLRLPMEATVLRIIVGCLKFFSELYFILIFNILSILHVAEVSLERVWSPCTSIREVKLEYHVPSFA